MTRFINKLWLIALFALLTACNTNKQSTSSSVKTYDLINQIAADNYVGTAVVGKGGGPSDAYWRRRELMDTATITDLKIMVYHENSVVSLTAFQALCEQNDNSVPDILKTVYAAENVQVQVIQGDVVLEMSTLEYAYGYVLGLPIPGQDSQHNALVDYSIPVELQRELGQRIVQFNSKDINE